MRRLLALCVVLGGPIPARAAHPWEPLAAVADVGSTTGVAAGAQLTFAQVGARVTAGWNLVTLLASERDTMRPHSFHLSSTGQVNADVFAVPLETTPGVFLGLAGGYKWNTLLGHGFGAGVDIQIGRSRHIGWHVFGGLAWFPWGDERVIREKDLPADTVFNFPFGAGWQMGAGVGIAVVP